MRCLHLERDFPKLRAAGYIKTSDATGRFPKIGAYNCIAWAAKDTRNWWWPDRQSYWPCWIKRDPRISGFLKTFRWLGYRICDNSRLEPLFEKVVLYARGRRPTHMARQLRDGTWTSKCGESEDITHFTLDALESYGPQPYGAYGRPVVFMRRFIPLSWLIDPLQYVLTAVEMVRKNR